MVFIHPAKVKRRNGETNQRLERKTGEQKYLVQSLKFEICNP